MTMALHGTSYGLDLGPRGTVGFTKQVKLQEVGGAEMNTVGSKENSGGHMERMGGFWKECEKEGGGAGLGTETRVPMESSDEKE